MINCCERCERCDGCFYDGEYCYDHKRHHYCECYNRCHNCGILLCNGYCHMCKIAQSLPENYDDIQNLYYNVCKLERLLIGHNPQVAGDEKIICIELKRDLKQQLTCICGVLHVELDEIEEEEEED